MRCFLPLFLVNATVCALSGTGLQSIIGHFTTDVSVVGELEKHFVPSDLDGHEICVFEKKLESRPESCPKNTIILLHGRTWSAIPVFNLIYEGSDDKKKVHNLSTMDLLAKEGIDVYAVDFRGFGGTLRDSTGWLTPSKCVADLKSVVDWLKKEKNISAPTILGWSQGGLVAQLYAQKYPESISGVILYASIYDPKMIYPRQTFLSKLPEAPRRKTTVEQAIEDFTLPGSISDESAFEFAASALKSDPVKVDWTSLHEFNEAVPARITVPTLIIHGSDDPYLAKDSQNHLFSRISTFDKAYVQLPCADHCAHLIDSRFSFVHHVTSFLKRPTLGECYLKGEEGCKRKS